MADTTDGIRLLIFAACAAAVVFVGTVYGSTIADVFEPKHQITAAQSLSGIRGAKAGDPVHLDPLPERVTYQVQKGDSWSRIAKKYGIRDYNELANHHSYMPLKPGMVIEIPKFLLESK